jgi:hypothetical protein
MSSRRNSSRVSSRSSPRSRRCRRCSISSAQAARHPRFHRAAMISSASNCRSVSGSSNTASRISSSELRIAPQRTSEYPLQRLRRDHLRVAHDARAIAAPAHAVRKERDEIQHQQIERSTATPVGKCACRIVFRVKRPRSAAWRSHVSCSTDRRRGAKRPRAPARQRASTASFNFSAWKFAISGSITTSRLPPITAGRLCTVRPMR